MNASVESIRELVGKIATTAAAATTATPATTATTTAKEHTMNTTATPATTATAKINAREAIAKAKRNNSGDLCSYECDSLNVVVYVQPMGELAYNVTVQDCYGFNVIDDATIAAHDTDSAAADALRRYAHELTGKRRTAKLGDELANIVMAESGVNAAAELIAATTPHVTGVNVMRKQSEANYTGERVVVRFTTDVTRGDVQVSVNTIGRLTVQTLRAAFAKQLSKLIDKERDEYKHVKPEKPAKKAMRLQLADANAALESANARIAELVRMVEALTGTAAA